MAFVIKDRVKESTTTTGTGAVSLGGADASFDTFSSAMSNGDTTFYAIITGSSGTDEWEVGLGTYASSGNTLTRTTVLGSSNSGSATNFSAGSKDVFMTYPADKAIFKDASGNIGGGLTTDKLTEGSSNLYYTDARVNTHLSGGTGVTYNDGAISIGQAVGTTDNVTFGNLTINGTTTTVNSTTVTVDDPIFTIGGDSAPSSDDNKDRGIEFRWHNGSADKVGFFGFDDSAGKFTFIPDATNSSEVFSGTAGTVVANLEGNVTGTVDGVVGGNTPAAITGTVITANTNFAGNITGNVTGNSAGTHTGAVDVNNNDVKNADLVEGQLIAGRYGSSGAPMTFTVTVASKTAAHPYNGDGSSSAYFINGQESPALQFHGVDNVTSASGYYYKFDQSAGSNSGHPLLFYLDADKTTAYTTNVTTSGTPGSSGAHTTIAVDEDTPSILYYQCSAHGYMGNHAVVLGSNKINHSEALITFPTASTELVGTNTTQTLTNKSIVATQLTGTVANARLDQKLQDITGLGVDDGNIIVADGSNFTAENGATARTSLGVAIGTNVQAYSANLNAISGLTSAADKGIQYTGSGTAGMFDLTAAGKALIDDADAAAQRTTLGLGTMAVATATDYLARAGGVMTGALRHDQDNATAGGSTLTLDLAAANNFKISITANTTIAFSNIDAGRFGNLIFVQDGTGGHSFTLPGTCKTPVNGATIVQATNANEVSVLSYYVLDSSNILVNYIGDFA